MLKASGFAVVGEEGSEYSFDILAARSSEVLAIKVIEHPYRARAKRHVPDLKKMSVPLDLLPLFVCEEDVPEDALVTCEGIPSISFETLERLIEGERPPFVHITKGGVYVKVRGDRIKQLRTERGMSLGELSLLLGVSRRMIYEYESGRSDVTTEVASKLVRVFGEEVLERLSLDSIGEHFKHKSDRSTLGNESVSDPMLRRIRDKLAEIGFLGLAIERAPFHLAAKKEALGLPKKLIIRKSGSEEDFEERFTLEAARLCGSYALFVKRERLELFGGHSIEISSDNLEDCLRKASLA